MANLIEKNDTTAGSGSEPKLPLVRIKVRKSGHFRILIVMSSYLSRILK